MNETTTKEYYERKEKKYRNRKKTNRRKNKMKIKTTSTNRSRNGSHRSMASAYDSDGNLIARVYPNKYNPLGYVKERNGIYRQEWIEQFISAGYTRREALNALGILY